MEVTFKLNEKLSVKFNAENPMAIFESLSSLEEVFSEECCGKCGGNKLTHRIRKASQGKKEFDYPELICTACNAKLTFGQSDNGALFPVRYVREGKEYVKGPDGKNIKKGINGWVKYNHTTGKEE